LLYRYPVQKSKKVLSVPSNLTSKNAWVSLARSSKQVDVPKDDSGEQVSFQTCCPRCRLFALTEFWALGGHAVTEKLSMWVIYNHPKDHPDSYVARRWEVGAAGQVATHDLLECDRLEGLRYVLQGYGLTCLTRSPGDDAKIVETWL
jgi:hypothetical protein